MSVGWGGGGGSSMVVGSWWGPGGGGKSAVQLLEESKSRYVKSDHVLGSSQTPARPERLHISSNPNIFMSAPSHTLHVSRPPQTAHTTLEHRPALADIHNVIRDNGQAKVNGGHLGLKESGQHMIINLSDHPSLAALIGPASLPTGPPLPARSPRVPPRPKIREGSGGRADLRRSLSHGPGDRDNVQMKLRRLLNTDSQENLATCDLKTEPRTPVKVKIGPPVVPRRPSKTSPPGTYRAEPATVTAHKSLPDLSRAMSPPARTCNEAILGGQRRPSCPGALPSHSKTKATPPQPPPRPPRMFRDPDRMPPRSDRPNRLDRLPSHDRPDKADRPTLPPDRCDRPDRPDRLPQPDRSNRPDRPERPPLPERPPVPPPPQRSPDRPPARPPLPQRLRENGVSGARPTVTLTTTDGRRSSDSDISAYGGGGVAVTNGGLVTPGEEGRRRPILRSRSDVTHERGRWEDGSPGEATSLSPLDLEEFFMTMGLDPQTHKALTSPSTPPSSASPPCSPPLYFEEVSSEESGPLGIRRASSDSDEVRSGPITALPLRGGEPSIVEKNARVIKWLFNCQKARAPLMAPTQS